MCRSSGPSAAESAAQENAARDRAKAEAERITAERDVAKETENAKIVADQAAAANSDAQRRAKSRTLLAGCVVEPRWDEGPPAVGC